MDSLVDSIVSANLGPKWQQLFRRLGIDPRYRYRIETSHTEKTPEDKLACCLRDTIDKWRDTVVKETDEREAKTLLLHALEMVNGFEGLARELAEANGIVLHTSPLVTDSPEPPPSRDEQLTTPDSSSDTSLSKKPSSLSPDPSLYPTPDIQPAASPRTSPSTVRTSPGESPSRIKKCPNGAEHSSGQRRKGRIPTQDKKFTAQQSSVQGHRPKERGSRLKKGSEPLSKHSRSGVPPETEGIERKHHTTKQGVASKQASNSVRVLDLGIRMHKYAILDVCQRLPAEDWEHFTNTLKLSQASVDKFRTERAPEERYYLSLKEWVSGGEQRHTVDELEQLLNGYHDAVIAMKARLQRTSE